MSLLSDFKAFALRGNLVDLAIGFTVGAAFTTVAESLVDDLIMPPLGLILGNTDFSDYYLLLRAGEAAPPPYETLEAAQAAGAVTFNYGAFLTSLLTFLVVAVAVFVLVRLVKRAGDAVEDEFGEPDTPDTPDTKKCAYCRENVPYQASRCPNCTSFLGTDGGPLTPDAAVLPAGAGGAA
ncbi:large conductance mechanosensitive channel protein MscL [Rubrivirga litoralis]|uniref:Large-conductance mechanosensitive channel n=1 Tax=Rubrivirga litoralis TaxID=3075598 RepID=A0ABU3BN75_9BACT|nr:large conductance mechanosensitive channel protein MscL [Rubrivirga sp. F394]MDT0630747.1 large conductance mechanosensitive channel protein MscL [Rubrivirga sp. F394]